MATRPSSSSGSAISITDAGEEQVRDLLVDQCAVLRPVGVIPVREIVDVAEEVGDQDRPRDVGAEETLLLAALDEDGELVVVLTPPLDVVLLPRRGQHV